MVCLVMIWRIDKGKQKCYLNLDSQNLWKKIKKCYVKPTRILNVSSGDALLRCCKTLEEKLESFNRMRNQKVYRQYNCLWWLKATEAKLIGRELLETLKLCMDSQPSYFHSYIAHNIQNPGKTWGKNSLYIS